MRTGATAGLRLAIPLRNVVKRRCIALALAYVGVAESDTLEEGGRLAILLGSYSSIIPRRRVSVTAWVRSFPTWLASCAATSGLIDMEPARTMRMVSRTTDAVAIVLLNLGDASQPEPSTNPL